MNAQKFIEEGYVYGPYRVSVIDNDSITLSRNNYYTKKAKVETIKFSEFNSKSEKIIGPTFIRNDLASIYKIINRDNSKLNIRPQLSYNLEFLAFNVNNPILSEKKIRQAIYLALDRKMLSDKVYKGYARPALDLHINSKLRIAKSYVERIEVAKKLIKESDYYKYGNNSKKIVLDLTFLKSDLRSKEAALIQDMFKKINIQLNLRPKNADQFAIITKEISYSGLLLGSINNLPDTNYYDLLSSKRIPKQINDFTGNNIFCMVQ